MRERLIDLLNILMSSDKSFVNELTSRLTVTSKTIRNEVRELNALLLDSGFPEFLVKHGTIENNLTKKQIQYIGEQYVLKGDDKIYLSPQQRILYLALVFLTARDPVFIVDVQRQLKVSKSSMDKDMRFLRRKLQRYHLQLTTSLKSGAQ
ncbi:MAG: hypothetical protein ABF469_10910, partial [Liquorilactobacillus satsumensis]